MASDRQTRANQDNSKKSTGPRTPQGKQRSSRNALKHGLTARDNLILGESPEAFAEYADGMWRTWDPVGAAEEDCVARLVREGWRLPRCARIETGLFVDEARRRSHTQGKARPRPVSRLSYILSSNYEPGGDPNRRDNVPTPSQEEIEEAPVRQLAQIYASGTGDELRKLDRHETAIHRRYQAALYDLLALQKKRLG
jgi:hypothetical protein